MNKKRLRALQDIGDDMEAISLLIKEIRDQEQEYHDNLPEGIRGSEKGWDVRCNIYQLSKAIDSIETARDALDCTASV